MKKFPNSTNELLLDIMMEVRLDVQPEETNHVSDAMRYILGLNHKNFYYMGFDPACFEDATEIELSVPAPSFYDFKGLPTMVDQEDFGTADLSEKPTKIARVNHSRSYGNAYGRVYAGQRVTEFTPHKFDILEGVSKVCDCGTHKTYGKSASLSMHSSWCTLRSK